MWDIIWFIFWAAFIFIGFPLITLFIWALLLTPKEERRVQRSHSNQSVEPHVHETSQEKIEHALKEQAYERVPDKYKEYVSSIHIEGNQAQVNFDFSNMDPNSVGVKADDITRLMHGALVDVSFDERSIKELTNTSSIDTTNSSSTELTSQVSKTEAPSRHQSRSDSETTQVLIGPYDRPPARTFSTAVNPSNKISQIFLETVNQYEKTLQDYSYQKYELSTYSFVYVVEDSFIIYIALKQIHETPVFNDDMYVVDFNAVFEELTYNDIFKFSFNRFRKNAPCSYNFIRYKKFHGAYKDDVDFLHASYLSEVEEALPFLHLRDRRNNWYGIPYNFIVFEIEKYGKHGIAVFHTPSHYVAQESQKAARELQSLAIQSYLFSDENKKNPKPFLQYGRFTFLDTEMVTTNSDMREILYLRICELTEEDVIKKSGNVSILFESELSFFTFAEGVKDTKLRREAIDRPIIADIEKGSRFQDYPREQFVPAKTKWKSEELMVRCIEKIYGKNLVITQHRPYFLRRSNGGQLSYDAYVHGKKIAFEYQGRQHFEPVDYFGGKEHFGEQVKRDKEKKRLSDENGVLLVYINYWEDINEDLIKQKVKEARAEARSKNK